MIRKWKGSHTAHGTTAQVDNDAAVERAMLLVWERGFATTTLAERKIAMGVTSPPPASTPPSDQGKP